MSNLGNNILDINAAINNGNFKNIELDSTYMDAYLKREKHKSSAELTLAIAYFIALAACTTILIAYLIRNWSWKHLLAGVIIEYLALIVIVIAIQKIANRIFTLNKDEWDIVMWLCTCEYLSAYYNGELKLRGKREGKEFDIKVNDMMKYFHHYKYNIYGRPQMSYRVIDGDYTHQTVFAEGGYKEEEKMTLNIKVKDAPHIIFEIKERMWLYESFKQYQIGRYFEIKNKPMGYHVNDRSNSGKGSNYENIENFADFFNYRIFNGHYEGAVRFNSICSPSSKTLNDILDDNKLYTKSEETVIDKRNKIVSLRMLVWETLLDSVWKSRFPSFKETVEKFQTPMFETISVSLDDNVIVISVNFEKELSIYKKQENDYYWLQLNKKREEDAIREKKREEAEKERKEEEEIRKREIAMKRHDELYYPPFIVSEVW